MEPQPKVDLIVNCTEILHLHESYFHFLTLIRVSRFSSGESWAPLKQERRTVILRAVLLVSFPYHPHIDEKLRIRLLQS
jgi:hypothetical protein